MKNFSRRQFLASIGPLAMVSCAREKPDIILYNADIITVNPLQPKAEAIAISGDKVVAIGDNNSILKLASGLTKKIDIENKTITPGFIDAHSHPASSGRSHLRNVDCDLRSIEEIKKELQRVIGYLVLNMMILKQKKRDSLIIKIWMKYLLIIL